MMDMAATAGTALALALQAVDTSPIVVTSTAVTTKNKQKIPCDIL